ncbi:glycolate oxidase subunit GlcE [Undibacterium fentianense]|uniref:Glycolate oxidase subunit GlcE n=1 Tax=Undibacterium fentianense TaxID=2828728 RepID=A0A941E1V2_9BURK|nr:glycolate oxidase subunit GlcE [Undibacterium fentianense]MBR7799436.1 glycolate oxidase subunit GlcE [Undibacterium fentianense]
MNSVLQAFREQILQANKESSPLRIQGSGSKQWYGKPVYGEVLDTRLYSGVIAYEPTELYITVRAGTPLIEVEKVLQERGQMLAFEPPHFGENATVGGMLAAGFSGPRRAYGGAVRDFVLGITMMNAQGECLKFGGQVMKNVAGFDVSRLLVGSLGVLGLILDITLKVMPRPQRETSLVFAMSEPDALRQLNRWAAQALPITGSVFHAGRLVLRLSGSESALRYARHRLGGIEFDLADAFWLQIREQQHHFFMAEEGLALLRLSMPSTAPSIPTRAKTLIEWGGAQRWVWTHESIDTIRERVKNVGGHVTQFRYANHQQPVFEPMETALQKVHLRIKHAFDPNGIFNRGQLFSDC